MNSAHAEVEKLLQQMTAALPANHPAHKASEQISVLCRGYMEPSPETQWDQYGLTRHERRIMEAMTGKLGRTVSKGALLDIIYFDRADEEPQIKIVDVFVCKARKKLAGSPWEIETVWGQGYRLKQIRPEAQAA